MFKWPNPSYYDHVKYMTWSRQKPFFGALKNEGVFAGIFYETESGPGFAWLREWETTQRYLYPDALIPITRFENRDLEITAEQTDLATPGVDLMRRNYKIALGSGSPVKNARLVLFANFNPMVSKLTSFPFQDSYLEYLSSSVIKYDENTRALIQRKTGRDISTQKTRSICLAMGLRDAPDFFQAGLDSIARPANLPLNDPFFQAEKGRLKNSKSARGQVSAGLVKELDFSRGHSVEIDFFISISDTENGAKDALAKARALPFSKALPKARRFWSDKIAGCPLPNTDDQRIVDVARLSLLVMLSGLCEDSGAMVASIATQSPYGEDWPRDGAFINEALIAAGLYDIVRSHNQFYIRRQAREDNPVFFRVPSGSWASNYYADGVPGMHVNFWQIDTTGFAVWTIWDYYRATGDRAYLEEAYPAIKRAADFLADFKDPKTGLQKKAHEFDMLEKRQTIVGALTVRLALSCAAKAAKEMNDIDVFERWDKRAEELRAIILTDFYNRDSGCFTALKNGDDCAGASQSWVLWPDELAVFDDPRMIATAERLWEGLQPSLEFQRDSGQYEIIPILALARAWKNDPSKIERVRDALAWEAKNLTTELGHFGEAWMIKDGTIIIGQAQPHVTHHALFYSAAMIAFPEKPD